MRPLFTKHCFVNSPLVALSNDWGFRPLRRTTKATRLGWRPLFEKRGAKTFWADFELSNTLTKKFFGLPFFSKEMTKATQKLLGRTLNKVIPMI